MQVKGRAAVFAVVISGWIAVTLSSVQTSARQTQPGAAPAGAMSSTAIKAVLDRYCVTCHNQRLRTAGLALDTLDVAKPAADAGRLGARDREASRRLDAAGRDGRGPMPPPITPWPAGSKTEIDRAWAAQSESGPDQRRPSPQSRRIQQRDPRPVRARRRREVAAARRRNGRRQLRQLRRRPHDFDRASRALPVGGAPGHAARDGPAAGDPARRDASRFRCTWCRTIGRAKTCRSDRAAASRFATTFRSTANT